MATSTTAIGPPATTPAQATAADATRTLQVGRMPYLNSTLFYQAMHGLDAALHPMVPTAMARAAKEGRLDAGPVPLLDALALLGEGFEQLGGFCIATTRAARSILLFSSVPIGELGGKRVAVTGETSTSARLLKVVLGYRYDVWPAAYVPLHQEAEATLLIGDAALKARHGWPGKPYIYDLGQEWHEMTSMPTVFALWVVRRDLPAVQKQSLADAVGGGLARGLDALWEARHGYAALAMSGDEVRQYLEGFSFRAGPAERYAIAKFARLVEGLPDRQEGAHA